MKYLIPLLIITVNIFAQKPYFIMVADPNCSVCVETAQMFSGDPYVKKAIHKYTDFKIVTKVEAMQAGLHVRVTPTFYFFAKNKKALLVAPLEGKPKNSEEFILYLKEVYNKYNQSILEK